MTNVLFSELELPQKLQQSITAMGFETATPVQAKTIPIIRTGVDVIAKSQTGTGKTVAFAIPMLERIDTTEQKNTVQVLILCPTRELAQQAGDEIRKLAQFMPGIFPVEVYGGTNMEKQFIQLRRANLVIGTPGRVMDHLRRKTLKLKNLKAVVLDEADEMLNMGFKEDIATILQSAPMERQTVLFSATMPPAIMALTSQFQKNPQTVEIDRGQVTIQNIDQSWVDLPKGSKDDALIMLLEYHKPKRALVFCNTKKMVDELVSNLNAHGFPAEGLHGDLNQAQRTKVMNGFKSGNVSILVATDVAARGIDVNDLDYVFNYDIPMTTEYYVHRIGRTGRAGKSGCAITLCSGKRQIYIMRDMARAVKSEIRQEKLPTSAQLKDLDWERDIAVVEEMLSCEQKNVHAKMVSELVSRGHSLENIAAAGLAMRFPLKERKIIANINTAGSDTGKSSERTASRPGREFDNHGFQDIKIDIGSESRVAPNHFIGAITERTGLVGKEIGKIKIDTDHSLVGVPANKVDLVLEAMDGCKICGQRVTISKMAAKKDGRDSFNRKPGRFNKPRASKFGSAHSGKYAKKTSK